MNMRNIALMNAFLLVIAFLSPFAREARLERGISRVGVSEYNTEILTVASLGTATIRKNLTQSIITSNSSTSFALGGLVDSEMEIRPSSQLTDSLLHLPIIMAPGRTFLPMVFNTRIPPSPDDSEELEIPAGTFLMGCDGSNPARKCRPSNRHLHFVYLDAYYIDKYKVTNARYQVCVEAGGCTEPYQRNSATRDHYYGNPDYANYPVIWVNWYQAAEFCKWANKRLPTEAEWEKAARGSEDSRWYPWGDELPDETLANFNEMVGDTTPVGGYPGNRSVYGVMDMAGNVWEWVNDWFEFNYYLTSPYENPQGPSTGEHKGRRGGTWNVTPYRLRSDYRSINIPDKAENIGGFRCVRSAVASQ